MNVKFAPRALADVEALDAWWRANRPDAPSLFEEELAGALEQLARLPSVGIIYPQAGLDVVVRRWLMPRTRNHIYYVSNDDEVVVLTVWGGPKGGGPRF